jgi:NADP-dependent alcohol dehydrogenase
MLNFELQNPTKYVFGKGQIAKLKDLVNQPKILMVYGGGSIFKNTVYEQVKNALPNTEIIEFGGVEANPKYETLLNALSIIKSENIQFILAVGGGSVIDGVKFLSGATKYVGDPIEILRKRILFTNPQDIIPFGTVLTIPATGSEMNSGSVISIEATQEKLTLGGTALHPQFSICDPSVVASLPKRQIENGVVDAFFHVMEQYLTYHQNALLQDRFAESILSTLIEIGPKVVAQPSDYNLAANFMWCATMALNGLLQKGVVCDWATHMIGHELTALYGIDHARTLAIIGPQVYHSLFENKKGKLAQLGQRVFHIQENSEEIAAQKTIVAIKEFLTQMGMPLKLSTVANDYYKTADIITQRFLERGWKSLGENQIINLDKVKEIVEDSY